jgi:hypothetical protein
MKHTFYMMSDFPPWQVYRWRVDHAKGIDVIERYDVTQEGWITHDNDLLRGAFMDQQDAGLTTISPISEKKAAQATAEGWSAIK